MTCARGGPFPVGGSDDRYSGRPVGPADGGTRRGERDVPPRTPSALEGWQFATDPCWSPPHHLAADRSIGRPIGPLKRPLVDLTHGVAAEIVDELIASGTFVTG